MINTVSFDNNTTNAHHSSSSPTATAAEEKRLQLKIKRHTYHGKTTQHGIIQDKDQQQQDNNKKSAEILTRNNTKTVVPVLSNTKADGKMVVDENANLSSTTATPDDNNVCNESGDNESEKSENDTLTTTTTTTTVQVKVKTTKTSRKRKFNSENNTDSNNEKTKQSAKTKKKRAVSSTIERQNSKDDTTISPTLSPSRTDRSPDDTVSSVGVHTEQDAFGPCEPGSSVLLEGIVWNETDKGVLVINVTWRGKTYVGALLNTTEQSWAPPRYKNDPRQNHRYKNNHHNTLSSSSTLLSSSLSPLASLSLSQSNLLSVSTATTQLPSVTNTNEPTERILRNGKRRGAAAQQQTTRPTSPGDFKVPPLPVLASKDLSSDVVTVKNELDSSIIESVPDDSFSSDKTTIVNENGSSTPVAPPPNYDNSTNGKDDDESSTSSGCSTRCSPMTTCSEAKTEINNNELTLSTNHNDTHVESVTPIDLSKTTTELVKDTEKVITENISLTDSLKLPIISDSINDIKKPPSTTTMMDFIQKTSQSHMSHQPKQHDRFSHHNHHHHHFSKSHHNSKSNKLCSKLDSTNTSISNSNKIKSIPTSPSSSSPYNPLSSYHQQYFSPHHQSPPISPFSPFRPEMTAAYLGYQQSSSPPHHIGERLSPSTKNMLNSKSSSPYLQLPSPVQQQLYFNSLLHAQNHSRYQAAAAYSKSSR
ncbi:unnamed protein product [Didymodactylos carnosus]|uniref:Uncharacterized protein n=1 Tax=Didymodactylos carnosus TaxID=1234261 RepID=A0A813PJU8_9BILA|nr:unnamed protein product [Didymodactylos carnosus]CAF0793226.1 unnamed protein product [Didymodactylos carnosus]CAF3536715.1 unnamed protein product [Didymodactylos carnosus]CAF3576004.1 unnamed protein product [Didymodactylos carnosus]